MRYKLKSLVIGFETPLLDLSDTTGIPELSDSINQKFLGFFDVLKINLELIRVPSFDYIFLFSLIVRIDKESISDRELESEWSKLESNISEELTKFLDSRVQVTKLSSNIPVYRKIA